MCFTVTIRTNKFALKQNKKYSAEQEKLIQKIKLLNKSGFGYRKISKILNEKNIKTSKGNSWKNTQVYSVLKRYRERQVRLEFMNRVYEPEWGKIEIRWEKNL